MNGNNNFNPGTESTNLIPYEENSVSEITNNNAAETEKFFPSDLELAALARKLLVKFNLQEIYNNIN